MRKLLENSRTGDERRVPKFTKFMSIVGGLISISAGWLLIAGDCLVAAICRAGSSHALAAGRLNCQDRQETKESLTRLCRHLSQYISTPVKVERCKQRAIERHESAPLPG
jgi:hypothetical protein